MNFCHGTEINLVMAIYGVQKKNNVEEDLPFYNI